MAFIPKPQFPNVPKLPGVPQLVRSAQFPAAPAASIGLGVALARLWQSIFAQSQWGIYEANRPKKAADGVEEVTITDRAPVIEPDSFGEFSFRNAWEVSDFPVQDGSFNSYNKVAQPFEIVLRLYKGGTKEARRRFIDSIAAIAGNLQLYDIVTPEKAYQNVNITNFEIVRRGEKGAYFLSEVDVFFREIREETSVYTTTGILTENAQNPSAAPVTNSGIVQAFPLTGVPGGLGL